MGLIKLLSGGGGGRGRSFLSSSGGSSAISSIKFPITHTAFQTAGLTNTITLTPMSAGIIVVGTRLKINTQFTGGAISQYWLSLGVPGDLTDLISEVDAFGVTISDTVYYETFAWHSYNYNAAVNLQMTARSVGANLSASLQGAGTLEVYYATKV